jgi:hypothetical protein
MYYNGQAIARQSYVELYAICTIAHRARESRQRIFRRDGRRSPVTEN